MVFLTSDPHGKFAEHFGSRHFPEGKNLTKNDFVIVLGDFGGIWFPETHPDYKGDKSRLQWLYDKPWTTLFVDGNHENFDMLNSFPEVTILGGKAHKINDKLFHLKRGEIFNIEGNSFFVFGGAETTDKSYLQMKGYSRTKTVQLIKGRDYWDEEIFSEEEKINALNNLNSVNYNVDYILTHTCPSLLIDMFIDKFNKKDFDKISKRKLDPVAIFLEDISYDLKFYTWFFGHFHSDLDVNDKYKMIHKHFVKI